MAMHALKNILNMSDHDLQWPDAIINGCKGGNIEIIELIIKKMKDRKYIFSQKHLDEASNNAHIELILFMLEYNKIN